MRASVIIPTYNRSSFLARTLTGFALQRQRDFEVIVVDDGGGDDSRSVVTGFSTEFEVRYHHREHRGISAARNAAIQEARGDILVFNDDDRVPAPDFIGDHVAAHDGKPRVVLGQQRGLFAEWAQDAAYTTADVARLLAHRPEFAPRLADARAEVITPAMLRERFAEVVETHAIPESWWESNMRPVLDRHGPHLTGFALPWAVGTTGNMSVPRAVAVALGGFDEGLVGWGLEDTDLHFRFCRVGATTRVLDGGVNYHQVHARGPERHLEWVQNAVRLLDKHASLEMALFFNMHTRQKVSIHWVNRVALEVASIGRLAPTLLGEVMRVNRDQFRISAMVNPRGSGA
jgi:GT2 family glycosyltransferase